MFERITRHHVKTLYYAWHELALLQQANVRAKFGTLGAHEYEYMLDRDDNVLSRRWAEHARRSPTNGLPARQLRCHNRRR
jgi:hypothetical protein